VLLGTVNPVGLRVRRYAELVPELGETVDLEVVGLGCGAGAGLEIADGLRFSAAVAALKCTRPGGRAGIPALAAVLGFLNECKEN